MPKLKSAILLMPIIALLAGAGQVALGDSKASDQMSVILVDRRAIAQAQGGVELAQSFVGLVSALRDGEYLAFMSVDDPAHALGPVFTGDPAFKASYEQVQSTLLAVQLNQDADLVRALAETYGLLGSQRAGPGSTVYLVTGGTSQGQLAQSIERLRPMISLFKESGWPIVGLSLPGSSPEFRELLSSMARDSGGDSLELSVPSGFHSLSEKILGEGARGSLVQLSGEMLKSDEVLTSTFSVAPGTREATVLVFKSDKAGSLTLKNPSGFEASTSGQGLSSIIDTPHVVIWKLADPSPGQWRVDARRLEGAVSTWHHASNGYSVALEPYGAVPLNESTALIASVTNYGQRVIPSGAMLVARVTSPAGMTLVHELNDAGVSGDSVAGDGYFTATIPPVEVAGQYKVELELSWPQFAHRISSQAEFRAQAFPAIRITPEQAENLRPGERSKVATLFVHVQGQPYAVPAEELAASVVSNADQSGLLEVKPQKLMDQGRAWMYDVFVTPNAAGLHTAIFRLNMRYAERQYIHTSEYLVLSSAVPVPPPEPVLEAPPAPSPAPVAAVSAAPASAAPASAAPVLIPSAAPQTPPVQAPAQPISIPWKLVGIALTAAAALAVAVSYWRSRPRPYGYLYDDREELAVDFANLKRNPLMSLISRSAVRGRELGAAGLEKVLFRFSDDSVGLRSQQIMPTVRVDDQPVIGQTPIHDLTRIGSHGRLYTFLLSPPTPHMQPGVGDGN